MGKGAAFAWPVIIDTIPFFTGMCYNVTGSFQIPFGAMGPFNFDPFYVRSFLPVRIPKVLPGSPLLYPL